MEHFFTFWNKVGQCLVPYSVSWRTLDLQPFDALRLCQIYVVERYIYSELISLPRHWYIPVGNVIYSLGEFCSEASKASSFQFQWQFHVHFCLFVIFLILICIHSMSFLLIHLVISSLPIHLAFSGWIPSVRNAYASLGVSAPSNPTSLASLPDSKPCS